MIVIIEDDHNIRELVCYTLSNTGFEANGYGDGKSFFDAQLEGQFETAPELILLDVMLPEEDGISILKKIRSHSKLQNVPVIMLTAKDTEYDKIVGLDNGADDYVTKPFGMMELISRIKAVIRRSGNETVKDETLLSYKELVLNDDAHTVFAANKQVELTLKEYSMLKILMANEGSVMNRDILLQKIWGYDFDGETRTVDVHIRTLRAKLLDCGEYIETVRGVGYKIGKPQ